MKDDQMCACAECHTKLPENKTVPLLLMMLKCVYIAEMNFSVDLKT